YGPMEASRSWNPYPRKSSSSPKTPAASIKVRKIQEPGLGRSCGDGTKCAARKISAGINTEPAAPAPPARPRKRFADELRFHHRPASNRLRFSKIRRASQLANAAANSEVATIETR